MKVVYALAAMTIAILIGGLIARSSISKVVVTSTGQPHIVPAKLAEPLEKNQGQKTITQTADSLSNASATSSGQSVVQAHPASPNKFNVKYVNSEKLQKLAELLSSPNVPPDEAGAIIRDLGKDGFGSEEIANFIISYFESPTDWTLYEGGPDTMRRLQSKLAGIVALSRTHTDAAKNYLLSLLDEKGAQNAAKAWLPSMPTLGDGSEPQTAEIQGSAAFGLAAYNDDPEIRSRIENMFQTEKAHLLAEGKVGGGVFNHLGDAMARMDLIDRNGLQWEYDIEENNQAWVNAAMAIILEKHYGILEMKRID